MWNDRLRFAESVEGQWKTFSSDERARLLSALEVIDENPIIGAPLLEPLRGYWSHRVDGLRIVYRIVTERIIVVVAIAHA